VEWLEGYIERLRLSGAFKVEETKNKLSGMFGSFLGECVIRQYGGHWAQHDGTWSVAFDGNNGVFPIGKTWKQMDNGLEDGIGSFFRGIAVLYGKYLDQRPGQNSIDKAEIKLPLASGDSDDDFLKILDEAVREHHYGFAHRELPGLIWGNPELYVSIFFDFEPDANKTLPALLDFLHESWEAFGIELPPEERLPSNGLDVVRLNLASGYQLVVITMPPAKQVAEAHMIAIAFRPEQHKEKSILRYFTLELGTSTKPDAASTMLCEWTQDRAHLTYDQGPPVEINAFCKAVEQLLKD
jgi:hypothetical protein